MALIIRQVLIVFFSILSFEFKSNCCDIIAKNEWPLAIHPTSIYWITFWEQCWSLITSCNRSQIQFLNLKMHSSWFGPHFTRESNHQCRNRLPQATAADTCQPTVDILNKKIIHVTDTVLTVIFSLFLIVFRKKIVNFIINLVAKIEGSY